MEILLTQHLATLQRKIVVKMGLNKHMQILTLLYLQIKLSYEYVFYQDSDGLE